MGVISLGAMHTSTLAYYLQLERGTDMELQAILEVLAIHVRKSTLLILLLLLEEKRTVFGEGCTSRHLAKWGT